MTTKPDDLVVQLEKVVQLAERAVDQYDICYAMPDDPYENELLFLAIRDLRRGLAELKRDP